MVTPRGFWTATNPAVDPTSDLKTFAQHNMNRTLFQKGDTSFVDSVLDEFGMAGYDEEKALFKHRNSTGVVEVMPVILIGDDADKPDAIMDNNNIVYFAQDTGVLSMIVNGVRRTLASGALSFSDDIPTKVKTDGAGSAGTGTGVARDTHQHEVDIGDPVDIGTSNERGTGPELAYHNHQHGGQRQLGNNNPLGFAQNASPGTSELGSHQDHVHPFGDLSGLYTSNNPENIGTTSSPGDSDDPARRNHRHGGQRQLANVAPPDVGTSTVGNSSRVARQNHGHGVAADAIQVGHLHIIEVADEAAYDAITNYDMTAIYCWPE